MRLALGESCEFINGGSWTEYDYREKGIPVLKVSNFNSTGFSINEISYLEESLGHKYIKNKLQINDIVIATVGSHPSLVNSAAGRTIRINEVVENYYLNQNAICLRTIDQNVIDQRFLYFLTEIQIFRNFIQQRGKGAANQMRIPISGIKDFVYDFPKIEIQRKIAGILSAYDDLIENNLKRIKILEEMAQQTYEEWFVRMRFPGYETAIFGEDGLPVGWEKDLVGNQLDKVKSTAKVKSADILYTGNIPVVDQSRDFIAGYTDDELSRISYVDKAFIVFGDHTRILKLVNFDFARGADGTQIVISRNNRMPQHLFYFSLKNVDLSNYHYARHYKYLKDSEILIPSLDIALEFEKKSSLLFTQIYTLQSQNQRLREARNILLPRLMMGMIQVENIEVPGAESVAVIPTDATIIPLKQPKKEASKEFKEAVLIACLTDKFGSEKFPLGRKRYTKLSYLFHRYADNKIQDYLRKAAGPYNPKTKYAGPEKIALNSKYIQNWKGEKGTTGFVAAEKIADAWKYFPNYWAIEDLDWLTTTFKFKSNDELELLATVDNSL